MWMIILREIRYECLGLINYLLFPARRRGHGPGPGDPWTQTRGVLTLTFSTKCSWIYGESLGTVKRIIAAIESEELGGVNHVILCTLCNCPRIAAARAQAS